MKQLFVKLQSPVIELPIVSKDSSGAKDSFLVGFKRFEVEESEKELHKFQSLLKEQMEAAKEEDSSGRYVQAYSTESDEFIKDKIVYIRQATLGVYDSETDKTTNLTVADTRKAKPNDFWENEEGCLDALLNLYLASSPTRSAIIAGMTKALLNTNYDEERIKN